MGYARFNLCLVDQESPSFETLFAYFPHWKTVAAARLLRSLYTLLWSLLLIVPGILAAYSYAATEFILAECPGLTAGEAIARSKELMYGNRWRLFCLQFSFIGWSILYGVCELCGYRKGDGYPTMMVFGIVFAAQVGMSIIPFKQVPLTVFSAYETMAGVGIDYGKYMVIAILVCVLAAIFFVLMSRYIFRPDMSKLVDLDVSKLDTEGSLQLNKIQKVILFFLILLVALLLAPNFLPRDFFVTRFLKAIGNTGIVVLLVTIMAAIKVDGKALLNFKIMVDSGVTWGIVLLLALVQPLSGAMARPESGITPFLMQVLDPLISGGSPLFFALFIGFAAMALTQVMNNGAVGVAFMPILNSYCQATGVPPEIPLIMIVMNVHYAFLTPAASASAALLHGNDWSDTKNIWKTAPLVLLMVYGVTAVVTVLLGNILF